MIRPITRRAIFARIHGQCIRDNLPPLETFPIPAAEWDELSDDLLQEPQYDKNIGWYYVIAGVKITRERIGENSTVTT